MTSLFEKKFIQNLEKSLIKQTLNPISFCIQNSEIKDNISEKQSKIESYEQYPYRTIKILNLKNKQNNSIEKNSDCKLNNFEQINNFKRQNNNCLYYEKIRNIFFSKDKTILSEIKNKRKSCLFKKSQLKDLTKNNQSYRDSLPKIMEKRNNSTKRDCSPSINNTNNIKKISKINELKPLLFKPINERNQIFKRNKMLKIKFFGKEKSNISLNNSKSGINKILAPLDKSPTVGKIKAVKRNLLLIGKARNNINNNIESRLNKSSTLKKRQNKFFNQ